MNIPIKVSKKMSSAPKSDEQKLIRIPQELRALYQADINQFVNIKSNAGKVITLKIMPAYIEDALSDPLVAYVCENVFEVLKITSVIQEQEIDLVEGITLGCDPEFFLVDQQYRLIYASSFFKRWGDVGTDGPMVELRPLPSTSEYVVAENIFNLIMKARYIMNMRQSILNFGRYIVGANVRMVAKSSHLGEAAGFHLHYGLPKPLLGPHKVNRTLLAGQIVKALDFYVGIPSIILEGEQDSFRRSFVSSKYGKPGAFNLDNKTLEYRVPGGYLLRHPVLTKGLLGLGAVVIEDVISRIKIITDEYLHLEEMVAGDDIRIVYPNIPVAADIYRSIVATTTTFAERNMDIIINDVRDMIGYNKRKESIEDFFQCITSKREYSNLLEENWRAYYNEKRQGSMAIFPT
jgi:hypothetical protein